MEKGSSFEDLKYKIALTLLPKIGDVTAKQLLEYFGSAKEIFETSLKSLESLPGFGPTRARSIKYFQSFDRVEEEIKFIKDQGIKPVFYTDEVYPKRLKYCTDGPVLLYFKGEANLNEAKILSIVGTREASEYGKEMCEEIIQGLKDLSLLVVSGLAYGIDITAHRACLKNGIPTVGVVAHGLDRLYPAQHKKTAREMCKNGGLLTDFKSGTNPDRQNFPARNRIVAGISDATLVIESGKRGGSLITAEIANSYNRDVFAVPGRATDRRSEGCNFLIHRNKAALVSSAKQLMELMNWEDPGTKRMVSQQQLFLELSEQEKDIVKILTGHKSLHIDDIRLQCSYGSSQVAAAILNLELQGVIKALPGKLYKLL